MTILAWWQSGDQADNDEPPLLAPAMNEDIRSTWRERERELKAETCLHKSELFTLLVRRERVTGKFGTCVKGQP